MPSLLNGVKDSIGSLKEELKDLQKTALRVDSGICDLSEVAESVRAATMIEENRVSAIEEFRSRTEVLAEQDKCWGAHAKCSDIWAKQQK